MELHELTNANIVFNSDSFTEMKYIFTFFFQTLKLVMVAEILQKEFLCDSKIYFYSISANLYSIKLYLYDIKIYFYSIKINLYSIKFIYMISKCIFFQTK